MKQNLTDSQFLFCLIVCFCFLRYQLQIRNTTCFMIHGFDFLVVLEKNMFLKIFVDNLISPKNSKYQKKNIYIYLIEIKSINRAINQSCERKKGYFYFLFDIITNTIFWTMCVIKELLVPIYFNSNFQWGPSTVKLPVFF